MYRYWSLSFDKCTVFMYYVNIKDTGWRVYGNSLHYLCNFSVNLNVSQNKIFILKDAKLWLWVVEEVWHVEGQCREVQADHWSLFSISYWKGKGACTELIKWKSWLKAQLFRKLRSWHLVPSLHGKYMGKQWKQCQTLFFWAPKSLQMVIAAMKLKDTYSLEGKLWPT